MCILKKNTRAKKTQNLPPSDFYLFLLIKACIMSFMINVKGDTQYYEEKTFSWV